MKDQPEPTDLASCGIARVNWHDGRVTYNDKARLAATRRAIITRYSGWDRSLTVAAP